MAVKPKKHAAASLSITPLIDVVFLLLIFFLVSTKFAEEERELDINLPTASEAQPLTAEPLEMIVNVDSEGKYFVEGKFRLLEELDRLLEEAQTNNPYTQSVVIRADKSVGWQHVLNAIDLCKKHDLLHTAMTDN